MALCRVSGDHGSVQRLEWSPFVDRPTEEASVARDNLSDNPGQNLAKGSGVGRSLTPLGWRLTTPISALSPCMAMRAAVSYVETYPKRLGARTRPVPIGDEQGARAIQRLA